MSADSRGQTRRSGALGIRRESAEASVASEIEHHIAEMADRLVSEGWSEADARVEAWRRFGDRSRYERRMRTAERMTGIREMARLAAGMVREGAVSVVRTSRRFPGFTIGIVLTMGLGLGANATTYGILNRLLLTPPAHIENPDTVRRVLVRRPDMTGQPTNQWAFAYPDYADLKAHGGMTVAGYSAEGREMTIGEGPEADRASVALASPEFFSLLGVGPRLGRFFGEEESTAGAPPTAVLSEEYWRRAQGEDPDVVGSTIRVNGTVVPVIGIAPADFTGVGLSPVDIWLPLEASEELMETCPTTERRCYWMSVVARLGDGVAQARAESEATQLHRNGRGEDIASGRYSDSAEIVLTPLIAAAGPEPSGESQVAKWLTGLSFLVVLLVCSNVANLLLARGERLRRENAVRASLGAGRGRLAAQATLEAVGFALLGGVVALGVARWGGGFVRETLLPDVHFPAGGVGGRIVLFTLALSLLAGLLAGFGPAIHAGRRDVRGDLVDAARGNSMGRSRMRGVLTASQASISVVLLIGAGLFVRSLNELRAQDLGFDMDRVLTVGLEMADPRDRARRIDAFDEASRRISALSVVESVAATAVPMGISIALPMEVADLDSIPRLPGGGPYLQVVGPGYFRTSGLALESGRPFLESDGEGAARVAAVSATMAQTLWPGEDPSGRCLLIGSEASECSTVVAVVEDAARDGYDEEPFMSYYIPLAQAGDLEVPDFAAPMALLARVSGSLSVAESAVGTALRGLSPDVRWVRVESLRSRLDPQARPWTLGATLFSVFGVIALAVAAVGFYSVLAFSVAQRTRELGIRAALGAGRGLLLRRVVLSGAVLSLIGVSGGLLAAVIGGPFLADLLYEVSPRDPVVLGLAATAMLIVGLGSTVVPGLRAARVEPTTALRAD